MNNQNIEGLVAPGASMLVIVDNIVKELGITFGDRARVI
jgi:predicted aspartyl protease